MKLWTLILGLVLIGGAAYLVWDQTRTEVSTVASFEECVAAGNPVMESYPRQCRAADGTLFVEEIEVEEIEEQPETFTFVTEQGNDDIIALASPLPGDMVASPLTITGQARGTWYFEGDFPVELVDGDGTQIAIHYATAQDEWMTEEYVAFESTLEFTVPAGVTEGVLILHRDNPSGLPENDDRIEIPVVFAQPMATTTPAVDGEVLEVQ
jgi:hypothetical protein